MDEDKKFLQRCIDCSDESLSKGDAPFAAIIVRDGEVVAESLNGRADRVSDHAEVLVLHEAHKKLDSFDLSECTLYSNCEPCPMCAFMIREYRIKRVVFALTSPCMGGHSRWNVLEDEQLATFDKYFGPVPEVSAGVLEPEAKRV